MLERAPLHCRRDREKRPFSAVESGLDSDASASNRSAWYKSENDVLLVAG
jgi:hypothetical protein